jgi:hypothetical protein
MSALLLQFGVPALIMTLCRKDLFQSAVKLTFPQAQAMIHH